MGYVYGSKIWFKSTRQIFLHDNIPNLSIPNEYGEDPSLFKTFKVIDNYELSKNIIQIEQKFINNIFQKVYQWKQFGKEMRLKMTQFWLFIDILIQLQFIKVHLEIFQNFMGDWLSFTWKNLLFTCCWIWYIWKYSTSTVC